MQSLRTAKKLFLHDDLFSLEYAYKQEISDKCFECIRTQMHSRGNLEAASRMQAKVSACALKHAYVWTA